MKTFKKFTSGAIPHFKYDSDMDRDDLYEKIKGNSGIMNQRNHDSRTYSRLGSGALGTAIQRKKLSDVNDSEIIKVSRTAQDNPDKDPYIAYIKAGAALANGNPHIPRVHEIHSIKTKNGHVHIIKMEKLHPVSSLNVKEHEAMHDHSFNEPYDMNVGKSKQSQSILNIYGNNRQKIATPEMAEAIDLVHSTANKMKRVSPNDHVDVDIHQGNIMARKTPYGPQMVITDPLASKVDLDSVDGELSKDREVPSRKTKARNDISIPSFKTSVRHSFESF